MLEEGEDESHHRRFEEPSEVEPTTPRVLTVLSFLLERLVARNDRLVVDYYSSSSSSSSQEQKKAYNNVDNGDHQIHQGGLMKNSSSSSSGGDELLLVREGKNKLKVFHGVRAPGISIPKYLERIYKYTNCSPSCFVVGYVYIDRLVHRHPDSLVVSLNVHRLLVTSVMVASKVLDDVHYNNAFYARVGGVSNSELNRLELELLFLLDFDLVVSSRIFESYCLHLEKEMKCKGVGQRIERSIIIPNSLDDHEIEISVDDTDQQSSSPVTHHIVD